ncbi:MAG: ParB N-terminal domain-containing protein [Gallionella sp.]|jgi:ParB/RepB/Spo0J family partition protein
MIEQKEVPITSIIFGERFREDYGDLSMLVESIKQEGIIQPLAVRDNGDETYSLLAGGRRYTAATAAKIETVPVRCYPSTLSELEMRNIELMENICRKDLEWHEAAKLKKEIYQLQIALYGEKKSTSPDAPGVSKRDVAKMIGVDVAELSRATQLADAIEIFPELKAAKNTSEANKMLQKMQENMVREELAKRISNKTASTPIERIHDNLINCYMVGDFFDGIKAIPNSSIDFIELDPPYAIDLNHQKRDMGDRAEEYNEVDRDAYGQFVTDVIRESIRVMSANSWLVMWHGKEWVNMILSIIQGTDLVANMNTTGIWYKGNIGQTNTPNLYLASCYEQFLYIRKGLPSIVRQGRSNVFHYKPVNSVKKIHPTERPIELIQDVMQTFCWEGARCLVPFLGSGNSILAASNLGMTAFGWDLSQEYKNGYIIRVSESRPMSYRSYKEDTNV